MDLAALLPFVLILVVGWLLLIRPQRKRQQAMSQLHSSLTPGMEVMLAGGLFATILSVEDDSVVVEAAPGVDLRYLKQAVLEIRQPVPGSGPESPTDAAETQD